MSPAEEDRLLAELTDGAMVPGYIAVGEASSKSCQGCAFAALATKCRPALCCPSQRVAVGLTDEWVIFIKAE